MNFFKAVISSAAASLSDFKYDYNPNTAIGPLGVFHFCQGTAKGSAEPVSILYCDKKKGASEEDVDAAKRAAKKFKTLRHPSVVKVLATSESDYSVYIAIERCRVLTEVLDEIRGGSTEHSKDSLYWGMRKMSDLLTFLSSASIIHANLLPDFIFVDRAGEWKLGGLEFVCEAAAYPTSFIRSRVNAACIPPECRDGRQSGSCDSTNAWLLGCLMYSAFAGEISDEKDVVNVGRMPREWQAAYKRIIASPPSRRMGPKELQSERLIANNEFISAMVFLDEFELHDGDEREEFMSHLPDKIGGMFAADVCIYRLLPRLLELSHISITGTGSQQGTGRGQGKGQEKDKQGSVGRFLAPLLKIGNLFMNADEFQQKISPVVVTAFASPDEKVKASLFANLGQFVEYLSDTVISKEVLPHVVSAMESNNAELKQMVLRALPSITPKLKESQVDGPLLKALGRCLNDQDARLRTNATVSLAMIGPSLPQKLQEKILVPSFTKRLRDPFPPARGAALRSLVANAAHLKPADLAKMALPAVVVLTVDTVEDVRQEALLCARTLLDHVATMSLQAGEDKSGEKGKEEVGGGGVGGSGGGAKSSKTEVMKWALSGMGTWATKLLEKTGKGSASTSSDEKGDNAKVEEEGTGKKEEAKKEEEHMPSSATTTSSGLSAVRGGEKSASSGGSGGGGGWDAWEEEEEGDDDGWGEEVKKPAVEKQAASNRAEWGRSVVTTSVPTSQAGSSVKKPEIVQSAAGWDETSEEGEDDDWFNEPTSAKPAPSSIGVPSHSTGRGVSSGGGRKTAVRGEAEKVKSPPASTDFGDDGWDDDGW